jgi:N-dimethylarginine dimethylaminohydrolase
MDFDREAAKKEGYSDKEITEYLSSRGKRSIADLFKKPPENNVIEFLETKDRPKDKPDTYSTTLELLMCPPKYLSAKTMNNKWMKEIEPEERDVNVDKAMSQFHVMYSLFSQDCMVYLLPPKKGLQDQLYITNAAALLPHMGKFFVLAKFKAKARPGEEKELEKFAKLLDYETVQCPYYFEGEAELKWVRDNIYIGGYGIRTDIEALDWMEKKFNAKIIKVHETDPMCYHLDCSIFPMSGDKIIYNSDIVSKDNLKDMEKIAECIPINKKEAQFSLTNSLRIGSIIYSNSSLKEMKHDDDEYEPEKGKNEKMEKICRDAGLELVWINLSEFSKSGAALSCCVLHLTYTKSFDMDK